MRTSDTAALVARLNRSASVQYAEVDKPMRVTAVPNDPRFAELYGLDNTGQTGGLADADIDAPEGWDAAGVAFNSQLAICKALSGPLGQGSTSDVASCIVYLADRGARVISMSLGGGDSTTLHNAVTYAYKNGSGALLVAAAGNDGDATLNYPAAYSEVVSVAATYLAPAHARSPLPFGGAARPQHPTAHAALRGQLLTEGG